MAAVRPLTSVRPVMVAYVLRLRSEALARGAVVGELEHVDTGRRRVLRSAAELLGVPRRPHPPSGELPDTPPDGPADPPP